VLLTALVLGIGLPSLVGYALVASFIGGFVYLVVQMPRGPHDPFDDGARI
jgi:Flp pilus assembly protein protease CpaA